MTLQLLLCVSFACGQGNGNPTQEGLPSTQSTLPDAGRPAPRGPLKGALEDAGDDAWEGDAETPCRRGFAGAVGIVSDSLEVSACGVLLPHSPLECIARRTDCTSTLTCQDTVWQQTQWAFDAQGQAEATLELPEGSRAHCNGQLSQDGYDMAWLCTFESATCTGTIRSYFE
ncbi:MAG: hypothetical protein H6714_00360 [Myxococcales bacterium]|nr:hypothetical protein [Myxococcales bacterium]